MRVINVRVLTLRSDSVTQSKTVRRSYDCGPCALGLLHAWVGQIVLKCNEFKTIFAIGPFSRSQDTTLAAEATPWLQPRCHREAAASGHAMTLRFKAGRALDPVRSRKLGSVRA